MNIKTQPSLQELITYANAGTVSVVCDGATYAFSVPNFDMTGEKLAPNVISFSVATINAELANATALATLLQNFVAANPAPQNQGI